jgi:hypothetical protein
MSGYRYFTIAEYAYSHLNHLMEQMQAKLKINLQFEGEFSGVDIWVHKLDGAGVLHYGLAITTLEQVDLFVTRLLVEASLQPLEAGDTAHRTPFLFSPIA